MHIMIPYPTTPCGGGGGGGGEGLNTTVPAYPCHDRLYRASLGYPSPFKKKKSSPKNTLPLIFPEKPHISEMPARSRSSRRDLKCGTSNLVTINSQEEFTTGHAKAGGNVFISAGGIDNKTYLQTYRL